MSQHNDRRSTKLLWGMILLGLAYLLGVYAWHLRTGVWWLDGSLGVLLGLYICSHPAANAVDLLFFERGAFRQVVSEGTGLGWLALNLIVLLIGWFVIVIGTTRFTSGMG